MTYQQDNLILLLRTCQFAANNHFSESLKTSPFLANYGWHPRFTKNLAPMRRSRPDAQARNFATQITKLHSTIKAELTNAQA